MRRINKDNNMVPDLPSTKYNFIQYTDYRCLYHLTEIRDKDVAPWEKSTFTTVNNTSLQYITVDDVSSPRFQHPEHPNILLFDDIVYLYYKYTIVYYTVVENA